MNVCDSMQQNINYKLTYELMLNYMLLRVYLKHNVIYSVITMARTIIISY